MDKLKIRFNFVYIDFDKAITWFICLYFSNGLVRLAARRVLAVARLQSSYILFANLIIYMPLILVLVLMISKRKIDKSLIFHCDYAEEKTIPKISLNTQFQHMYSNFWA